MRKIPKPENIESGKTNQKMENSSDEIMHLWPLKFNFELNVNDN